MMYSSTRKDRRFNIALIEAVFTAACKPAFEERRVLEGKLDPKGISALETDPDFLSAAARGTTQTTNVDTRLTRGSELISLL